MDTPNIAKETEDLLIVLETVRRRSAERLEVRNRLAAQLQELRNRPFDQAAYDAINIEFEKSLAESEADHKMLRELTPRFHALGISTPWMNETSVT